MVTYPKDWNGLTLGDLGSIKMCRRIFSHQTEKSGQIPFYKIGTFGNKADAYISRDLYESYKSLYPYPKKGDILVSAAGTIGRTVAFDGKDAYFQDSNIVWLDTSDGDVDNAFLKYFYESYPWTNLEGTTIRRLYNSLILGTSISLPSLPEQKIIAETLSCIDTHIANLTELIEKKKAIRDGALEDLVRGKTRLEGFNEEWDKTTIGGILSILHGRNQKDVESFYGKYPILGTGGFIGKATEYLCDWECVLIGRKGTIDKPMYMNTPFWTIDTLYYSRPKASQCVKFQYYLFCTIDWYAYTESSGRPSLAKKVIEGIEVKIPKFDEQKAIVEVLSSLDTEIVSLEEEKDKMLQIKAGAMDNLLTGRVRLM